MTEIEALKYALTAMLGVGAGLVGVGVIAGKTLQRLGDHSKEIHSISINFVRLCAAVNRIAEELGIEGVSCYEDVD